MIPHKGMAARPSRSLWLLFPWFIAAAMSVVIAVNCFMAWSALHTFPGNAGSDGFDLSNRYNAIIQRMKQEAGLGWGVAAQVDQAGHPVVVLTGSVRRRHSPGATIEAIAQRPLGDRHAHQGAVYRGLAGAIPSAPWRWTRKASGSWKSGLPPAGMTSAQHGGWWFGDGARAR